MRTKDIERRNEWARVTAKVGVLNELFTPTTNAIVDGPSDYLDPTNATRSYFLGTFVRSPKTGFTLIEMIGVLAIMAIMASVMVPTTLRTVENAAVKAESETMANLAEQIRSYVREKAALPGAASWDTDLAPSVELSSAQILTNKRQVNRLYVIDPTAPSQRVLLLSSMRNGLNLPNAATVRANFDGIWNAGPTVVPPGFPAVWSTPASATQTNLEFLIIQRVNLRPIFLTDAQTIQFVLNKVYSGGTVGYQLISGSTRLVTNQSSSITAPVGPVSARPRDQLKLYVGPAYGTLTYTYIFSSNTNNPLTFEFVDSNPTGTPYWRPQ